MLIFCRCTILLKIVQNVEEILFVADVMPHSERNLLIFASHLTKYAQCLGAIRGMTAARSCSGLVTSQFCTLSIPRVSEALKTLRYRGLRLILNLQPSSSKPSRNPPSVGYIPSPRCAELTISVLILTAPHCVRASHSCAFLYG